MSNKKTILIVDDDVDFTRIVGAILAEEGYKAVTAATGAEGLEKAAELKPDAILLDFMMETVTQGAPTAQALRQIPGLNEVPIILVTAVRRIKPWWNEIAPNQDWLPVSKVLEKPVSREALLAALRELMPA